MAHRLTGWTAIGYAEKHGGTLKKFTDPTERALKRVSLEKAKRVAREDSRLIYMDVKHGNVKNPSRRKAKRKNAPKSRSVSLKNFTGKVKQLKNGAVVIQGRGKRK
jgi:hypothetical protein